MLVRGVTMLSRTAEYALRAMSHVARAPEGAPVRAAELSQESGVPLAYLSKVLRRLVVAGLLTAEKGHHGGFRLARPAAKIRFSEILQAAESAEPVECAFGWKRCDPAKPCPMHPTWTKLKTAYRAWADETTLADVRDAPAADRAAVRSTVRSAAGSVAGSVARSAARSKRGGAGGAAGPSRPAARSTSTARRRR
jgi:Rrf2 family protein